MRRSALFVVGCALSLYLLGAAPAWADNGPHVKDWGNPVPDKCAACHRAHTAQAEYLLKEDQEALCFSCHGSSGTGSSLDVADGVGYSGHTRNSAEKAGALRGGGFNYALIDSNNVTRVTYYSNSTGKESLKEGIVPPLGFSEAEATTSTHSIGAANQTIWGNGVAGSGVGKTGITLECGACHDPHGNGNYRILKGKPDNSGATTEINIPDVNTGAENIFTKEPNEYKYTTGNYWNSWDTNDRNYRWLVSNWCTTCHSRYLAPHNSYKEPLVGDSIFTYRHRTEFAESEFKEYEEKPVKIYDGSGNLLGEEALPNRAKPNCIQCHVAHGSNSKMGSYAQSVAWPGGSARGSDSSLLRLDNRGVCQTCHHK